MADQRDASPASDDDVEDLRESAKEMGVDDADDRSPEDIVDEVRRTGSDSEASPSEWRQKDGG